MKWLGDCEFHYPISDAIMETLVLKSFDVFDNFEDHTPVETDCFQWWVTLGVGPADEDGETLYQICVCTPRWLEQRFGVNDKKMP